MATILVIDDNPEVCETLVNILEDAGYAVASAQDGREGMLKFRSIEPDLVITDIFMPNQEGIQTIREILSLRPQARIIAASGGMGDCGSANLMSGSFYLKLAQKMGALDILPKPFEIEDLIDRVERLLADAARGKAQTA